jgi:AcrR family transcriptional regulator
VRAARDVFSELGYDAATFQAIAVRADLTRPAINHYFASKRLLYREVIEQTNLLIVQAGIEKARDQSTLVGQMEAFLAAALQADSEDRSAARFLVTSVFESQRHPELRKTEHDGLADTRTFLLTVINDAIERRELATDTDVPSLVDMLFSLLWGMGFYAGFVGSHEQLRSAVDQMGRLLNGTLWNLGREAGV